MAWKKSQESEKTSNLKERTNRHSFHLEEVVNDLPKIDKLFIIWIGNFQNRCRSVQEPSRLCQLFPDMTAMALFLEGKRDHIYIEESEEDFKRMWTVVHRTALYREFVIVITGALAVGMGLRYALRKWGEYVAKRKGNPEQRQLENRVMKPRSKPKTKSQSRIKSKSKK